jgi:hypothetical protein
MPGIPVDILYTNTRGYSSTSVYIWPGTSGTSVDALLTNTRGSILTEFCLTGYNYNLVSSVAGATLHQGRHPPFINRNINEIDQKTRRGEPGLSLELIQRVL